MKNVDFLVFGNNVSAMVSAIELAKSGNSVVLFNPTPNWGAHFSGVKYEGNRFDYGMNYFEFTTFNKQFDNLLEYTPSIRNHVGHFCHLAGDYVQQLIKVHKASVPQMLLNGNCVADIVMSNQFDLLVTLPSETKLKIKKELRLIIENPDKQLHPINKVTEGKRFIDHSYQEVSIANHGKTFHNLIVEPICQKILNLSSASIPALFHRVAWAPLFYPETLLEALETGRTELPETTFYYPSDGSFGDLIDAFENSLGNYSELEVIRQKTERLDFTGNSFIWNGSIQAKQLVWTSDQAQLLGLLEGYIDHHSYQKASISIGFCSIENQKLLKPFSTLYILDSNNPLFRITNQTFTAGRHEDQRSLINIEFNTDNLRKAGFDTDESVKKLIMDTFVENSIIEESTDLNVHGIKHLINVLNAPTMHNLINFTTLHSKLVENYPGLNLLGSASGFVSTSFNDHIVQGLKIGKMFMNDKIV
jgi:hypothetical protein